MTEPVVLPASNRNTVLLLVVVAAVAVGIYVMVTRKKRATGAVTYPVGSSGPVITTDLPPTVVSAAPGLDVPGEGLPPVVA